MMILWVHRGERLDPVGVWLFEGVGERVESGSGGGQHKTVGVTKSWPQRSTDADVLEF